VATSKKTPLNDRLFAHASTKKKDVATKRLSTQTIGQSLMPSVGESLVVWQYTNFTLVDYEIRSSEAAYCS